MLMRLMMALLFVSATGWAQEKAVSPNLLEIMRPLIVDSPLVQSAQARLTATRALYRQHRAALLPGLSMDFVRQHTNTRWETGRSSRDPTALSLSLTQPIFQKQAVIALRQTNLSLQAVEADLEAVRQETLLEAVESVINLLKSQEVVELARHHVRVTEQHLKSSQARQRAGILTATDVSQARSRLAFARAEQIREENTAALSVARYREITGQSPSDFLKNRTAPVWIQMPPVLNRSDPSSSSERRPDLQAARLRLKMDALAIDRERAGHLPTASLTAGMKRTWDVGSITQPGEQDEFSLKLGVTLPIFSGGMTSSLVAQSVAERKGHEAEYRHLLRKIVREITESELNLQSAQASLQAFEIAKESAVTALDGIEQGFNVGTRTMLDLLDAQHELFSRRVDFAKSRFDLLLSQARFLKATGAL